MNSFNTIHEETLCLCKKSTSLSNPLIRLPGISNYKCKDNVIETYIGFIAFHGFDCRKTVFSKGKCNYQFLKYLNNSLTIGGHDIISLEEYMALLSEYTQESL